ncbi:hypothetical protein BDN71DRAFT_1504062 [Pleurotus eryngii]|uniref:NADH:flavin oxidoreductase/NADH oxidase N-terminal domain-containing protein n=1 Tax=Pleurotus eryngii TaxID=5323 RepID=A0A9P6A5Q4_PLEER|nr:hypothetical protein BDN71DRAFT_1504062 [Pleurotus eryngii]
MPASSQATYSPQLFQLINVGRMTLRHRVVLAPLTRFRTDAERVSLLIVSEYDAQRGGARLITEAVHARGALGEPQTQAS